MCKSHCLTVAGPVGRSATYRGNVFMNRLMIEHVGGVQPGVHRRVVAPGAIHFDVAFVRGVASSGGGQQCVCAISVPTAADLPSLLANSFQVGSPYFVMSTHLVAELDVMICKSTSLAGSIPRSMGLHSELVPGHMRSQATTRLFAPSPLSSFTIQARSYSFFLAPTRLFTPPPLHLLPPCPTSFPPLSLYL